MIKKAILTDLHDTRQDKKTPAYLRNRYFAEIIFKDLKLNGKFHSQGSRVFYFSDATDCLFEWTKQSTQVRTLLYRYGINSTERIFQYVDEHIYLQSLQSITRAKISSGPYYDESKYALYIPNGQQILKVNPIRANIIKNGGENIIFMSEKSFQKFSYQKKEKTGKINLFELAVFKILFSDLSIDETKGVSAENAKLMIFVWFLSLFFGTIQPTRVILAQVGPKGSGKSCLLRSIGKVLFGSGYDLIAMPNTKADLDNALTNNYLAFLDNADSQQPWLCDTLATAATGGKISKRMLYTTNQMVDYPLDCFTAITSRTPHFRRDDIASRTLPIHYISREECLPEFSLFKRIMENREEIMNDIVFILIKVVQTFKDNRLHYKGKFRIADFADVAINIGQALGLQSQVRDALEIFHRSQSSFTLNDHPILLALKIWIKGPGNEGRLIGTKNLSTELFALAIENEIPSEFFCNANSFGQRFGNIKASLSSFFQITEVPRGGNKKEFTFKKVSEL